MPLIAAAIFIAWDWRREAASEVIVYRGKSCDCCLRWAAHLRENGLRVYVGTQDHVRPVRERYGVRVFERH